MHDAIKTVAKEYTESQTDEVVSGVITAFNEFIVATPPENERLNTRHIAPHLKALTTVTDKVFLQDNFVQVHDKEISEKCKNLGNICQTHCEFEEAKTYFQYSLTFKLQELGPEHVNVATNYNDLALIYKDLGDFEQAKEYQQRALDIELDKLGPEHINVARSYNNLASICQDLGDLEQAKEYQQRALAITADKHRLNKTPNKVHEGLLTDAKNFIMEIIFLLDRFYAVFKVYLVGVVLKFERLNFSGFFSQQHKLYLKLRGSSLHFFFRSSNI